MSKTQTIKYLQIEILQPIIFLLLRSSKAQISQEVSHYKNHVYNELSNYRRYISDSDRTENCKCSCKKCDKPKRCCKKVCTRCRTQPQLAQYQQVPASLVMIPYPVPFFVYPIKNTTQSNQTITTKSLQNATDDTLRHTTKNCESIPQEITKPSNSYPTTVTSSTMYYHEPSDPECSRRSHCLSNHKMEFKEYDFYDYYRLKHADQKRRELKIMHNIRPTIDIRDTKSKVTPMRRPRYGLVSIPDYVSEKLMKQLKK